MQEHTKDSKKFTLYRKQLFETRRQLYDVNGAPKTGILKNGLITL